MRRISMFFVSLMILVATLAHATDDKKASRYYVGIGAQLNKESNGSFTVGRILPGSPADLFDLKQGDVIVSFDHVTAQAFWLGNREEGRGQVLNLSDWLKDREGRQVSLRIQRGYSELDINIYPVQIDRVAWVPMDKWFENSTGTYDKNNKKESEIVFETKVSENKTTGKFTYQYKIANNGKSAIFVNLEVLDIASGGFGVTNLVYLKPGKTKEFSLVTEEFPAEIYGEITTYEKMSKSLRDYEQKELGFSVPNSDYWPGMSRSIMMGFVPCDRLVRYQERNK